MNKVPTIPCPICESPVHVQQVQLPSGDIARVFTEPLSISDKWVNCHEHQIEDMPTNTLH